MAHDNDCIFVGQLVNLVFGDAAIPCTVVATVIYDNELRAHLEVQGFNTKIYNVDTQFIIPIK